MDGNKWLKKKEEEGRTFLVVALRGHESHFMGSLLFEEGKSLQMLLQSCFFVCLFFSPKSFSGRGRLLASSRIFCLSAFVISVTLLTAPLNFMEVVGIEVY